MAERVQLRHNKSMKLNGPALRFSAPQRRCSRPGNLSLSFAGLDSEMAKRSLPDLGPTALGRLVEGMTTTEVEAVIGRYHRPNLCEGRRYYAWIGAAGMLRACFEGPGGTLSKAIIDVAEEQRVLHLRGNVCQRIKNCTIIRTWNCITCRRRYRCSALPPLVCPICHEACEHVPLGVSVPPPKRMKAWDEFWMQYKTERSLLGAFTRGDLRESVKLEVFEIHLKAKVPVKRKRGRTKRCT
jgi:hypothetical protein